MLLLIDSFSELLDMYKDKIEFKEIEIALLKKQIKKLERKRKE